MSSPTHLDQPTQVAANESELAAGVARADRGRVDAILKVAPIVVPYIILAVLVAVYGSVGHSVFTLEQLNIQSAAVMTLLLVASGQTIVILLGGIDLSVGGVVSLTTALVATRLDGHGLGFAAWLAAILLDRARDRRSQRPARLAAPAPAVHRHARHLVGVERRRVVDPPDRGRQRPRAAHRRRERDDALARDAGPDGRRARALLGVVQAHPCRLRHPRHGLERELRLSLGRPDGAHDHDRVCPVGALRDAGRAVPDDADCVRVAHASATTTS